MNIRSKHHRALLVVIPVLILGVIAVLGLICHSKLKSMESWVLKGE